MNCVFVRCQVAVAKAKEWALLFFKQIKLEKDGVPHLYTITTPKMKIKLFNLVIRYTSCGTFFRIL